MTVDGFVGGPNGEMNWVNMDWTPDINQYVSNLISTADTVVLGRKLAEGFIPHWAAVAANPEDPETDAGKRFTNIDKLVFSKTLEPTDPPVRGWANTVVVNGDLVEEIRKLKSQDGQDIYVYGGASFVSALIKAALVDEFYLFINPVILGNGLTIFKEIAEKRDLTLVESKAFDCGVVLLNYRLT